MKFLGFGLAEVGRHDEALGILETQLATDRRLGAPLYIFTGIKQNMSSCLVKLGRRTEALKLDRECYDEKKAFYGESHLDTLRAANNLGCTLAEMDQQSECISVFREALASSSALEPEHALSLSIRANYARVLSDSSSRADLQEAVKLFEGASQITRRVLGPAHPDTANCVRSLDYAREKLAHLSAVENWIANPSRVIDPTLKDLPLHYVKEFEAMLAHDIYDLTLVSDADAWAARRIHYVLLYRASERAGIPTFIAPPPGCGEDEYDLRALAESIGNLDIGA